MGKCYFELRKKPSNGNGLSTDTMRHLHTRQHLGKAVVICDHPLAMLSAARKQWLRLSRYVQKQRAATLDADKILKYTHAVTHMQHMRFTAKSPLEEPDADAFFLTPDQLNELPAHCLTTYVTTALTGQQAQKLFEGLAPQALVVDYHHKSDWQKTGFHPKQELETQLEQTWRQLEDFLGAYHIKPSELFSGSMQNIDAIDEALDILLGASQKFLRIAHDFNQALELARPLRLSKQTREQYDAATLLAHRVQALMPGAFTQQFLETYSEDDTFFLHDPGRELLLSVNEPLADAIERHLTAGRNRLAEALKLHHMTAGHG